MPYKRAVPGRKQFVLTGLARGSQQFGKLKKNYQSVVKLLVELASVKLLKKELLALVCRLSLLISSLRLGMSPSMKAGPLISSVEARVAPFSRWDPETLFL